MREGQGLLVDERYLLLSELGHVLRDRSFRDQQAYRMSSRERGRVSEKGTNGRWQIELFLPPAIDLTARRMPDHVVEQHVRPVVVVSSDLEPGEVARRNHERLRIG
jgi:hypothetical protein